MGIVQDEPEVADLEAYPLLGQEEARSGLSWSGRPLQTLATP